MDPKERDRTRLSQIDSIFKCTMSNGDVEYRQIKEMKENVKTLLHKMQIWSNKKIIIERPNTKGLKNPSVPFLPNTRPNLSYKIGGVM